MLATATVVDAEIPAITCDGDMLYVAGSADQCDLVASAMNKLNGVSNVECVSAFLLWNFGS